MNVKEQLLQGNKEFLSKSDKKPLLNELCKGQKPYALVICIAHLTKVSYHSWIETLYFLVIVVLSRS